MSLVLGAEVPGAAWRYITFVVTSEGLLSGQGGESGLDSDSVLIGVLRLIGR